VEPVTSRLDVIAAQQAVKRAAGTLVTNFFPAPEKVDAWIGEGRLFHMAFARAVIFVRRDRSHCRLLFFASDPSSLGEALAAAGREAGADLVADLVGKPPELGPLTGVFERSGFVRHQVLVRMNRAQAPSDEGTPASNVVEPASIVVEPAGPGDVRSLCALMDELFDPVATPRPDVPELERAVSAGAIDVVRREGRLAALLFCEPAGKSAHIRFWGVEEARQNEGLGSLLMRHTIRTMFSRHLYLWVDSQNADAIDKYLHYGFRADGLEDAVMWRRKGEAGD